MSDLINKILIELSKENNISIRIINANNIIIHSSNSNELLTKNEFNCSLLPLNKYVIVDDLTFFSYEYENKKYTICIDSINEELFSSLKTISLLFCNYYHINSFDVSDLLLDILKNKNYSHDIFLFIKEKYAIETKKMFLIVFDSLDITDELGLQSKISHNSISTIINFEDKTILFLFSSDNYLNYSFLDSLCETQLSNNIVVSNIFDNFNEILISYNNSCDLLKLIQFNKKPGLYFLDNYEIIKIINLISKETIFNYLERNDYISIFNKLDKQSLETIKSYYDNNFSISKTSEKLFIHRNTLIYRLEKIKNNTGFNLQNIDESIMFRIIMIMYILC